MAGTRIADLFSVAGKHVLVTGAASGIGLAISEALSEGGVSLVMADVDAATLEHHAKRLTSAGGKLRTWAIDIAARDELAAGFDRLAAEDGPFDVVFANAGISSGPSFSLSERGRLENLSADAWDRAMSINLTGAVETMRAAARNMNPAGGRIIVTASISGLKASPVSGYAYVAAKGALINIVRHAAVELGPRNICVNAIAPGFIITNLAGGALQADATLAAELAAKVPLARLGRAEELVGPAIFLATAASSYVTGTIVTVDGGVVAN
jgi:NAD(P)-dependent dehydrogenase (short-subunit alcohol dehydrogenase family)